MAKERGNDNELIDEAEREGKDSHQGSSGGNLARKVGQRDELKSASGEDPLPTSVNARDKPGDGDMPTPRQTRK